MSATLNVVRPGTYKRKRLYPSGRVCKCGTIISVYNRDNTCYTCTRL